MSEPSQRDRIEADIRSEDARTLSERANRLMQVSRLQIVPDGPFAAPSAECIELFRDGRFYGCITLAQAVTEAVVRHIYWTEFPNADQTKFLRLLERLEALHRLGVVRDEMKTKVESIWERRNDFHHLDPSTVQGHEALEALAKEKLTLLSEVESEFFGYSFHEGAIVPSNPRYWHIKDEQIRVYLRRW